MKKYIKRLLFGLIVFVLSVNFMLVVSANAGEPYNSYNYDRWGEAIPSQAGYAADRSISGKDLGISDFDSPSDIFCDSNGVFYIADSGNNRIVALNSELDEVLKIYEKFRMPDGSETSLKTPSGVFVSAENDLIYIADTENSRVLVSSPDGDVKLEINKPDSEIYDAKKTFLPQKVIADKAGNVYVVLNNITTGAAMFGSDGEFMGFYGANRSERTSEIISRYITNIFTSEEKRSRRSRNIPSGITNFDIDGDFIFTCSSSSTQKTDTIKKLNAAGKNIFANLELSFGDYTPMYDTTQNKLLASAMIDIDISEDGNINCLDFTTGRIFQYDKECNLLFITGTNAKQLGGFVHASAVESRGKNLYVTDSQKNTITVFAETDFGAVVHEATTFYNAGYYDKALMPWQEVLRRDGNYRMAYIGVASAFLRQENYKAAMKYAKLAYAGKLYDKAFEGYRIEWLKNNFGYVIIEIAIFILIYIYISQRLNFSYDYSEDRSGSAAIKSMSQKQWLKYVIMHPFEGFEDMRWKKSGSLKIAFSIVFFLFVSQIAHGRLYGFQFYISYDKTFNIIPYIVRSIILFAVWTAGNWSVCTLFDGEGTAKNICIYSAYALVPYIVQVFVCTLLSHVLIRDEYIFIQAVEFIGTVWTVVLLFSAIKSVHQYSFGKTVFAIILTVTAMLIMLFLMVLFMSLIQQVWIFISTIYTEISYRIRV